MSQSTTRKAAEQLNIQENAENNLKSNSTLTEREPIPGTPFISVMLNNEWFIIMGDYRITETCSTKQEAIQWIEDNKWLVIMNLCAIAVDKMSIQNDKYKAWKEKNLKEEQNTPETESIQPEDRHKTII